jgi:RimJ/RimL family protein N-acetyltransferase
MDIGLRRITNEDIVIATMQECWDEMCEDGSVMTSPDLLNEHWIGVTVNNSYAGFFRFASLTSVMAECHVCILKPFRRYIKEMAIKAYEWLLESPIQKLSANIPSFNKGAIKYAEKMGFSRQGENTDSYMKNGKLHSMIQMGINRKDMEDLCHQ